MHTGACLCGAIRYQVAAAPFNATICHCRSCRMAAGAANVAWFSIPAASLTWTAGEPRTYRSSARVTRTFCGTCGTALTYHADGHEELDLTISSLDDPEAVPPRDHTMAAERLTWDVIDDALKVWPDVRGL